MGSPSEAKCSIDECVDDKHGREWPKAGDLQRVAAGGEQSNRAKNHKPDRHGHGLEQLRADR